MTYSNKLNLDKFFKAVEDLNYVIVKGDHFPDYYKGGDIDIICKDKNEFSREILELGNYYVNKDFEMRASSDEETAHVYIDFYINDELEFRFDIHGSIPIFKKIKLKKDYISSLLKDKVEVSREYNKKKYSIYVPSEIDDLLLRYIEYIEWFEQRPDKIKHLDFILSKISSDKAKLSFLDKLHSHLDFLHVEHKDKFVKPKPDLKPRTRLKQTAKQKKRKIKQEIRIKLYHLSKKLRLYNLYKKIKSKI